MSIEFLQHCILSLLCVCLRCYRVYTTVSWWSEETRYWMDSAIDSTLISAPRFHRCVGTSNFHQLVVLWCWLDELAELACHLSATLPSLWWCLPWQHGSSMLSLKPCLQLRLDYDPTTTSTIRLQRIMRTCFQFNTSKKWTCQFFVVVVLHSSRIYIIISVTSVTVKCTVVSSYHSRIVFESQL